MKNLILCFLVFITTFLNAQSVDPETFPTVVGAISGKNLYTNTGGEGKISVQSIIDSAKLISGDFIPLSGTTVGNPVTGDINSNAGFLVDYGGGAIGGIFNDGGDVKIFTSDAAGSISLIGSSFSARSATFELASIGGTPSITNRGFAGSQNYTSYITDLDYTQKIYVDTKVAKIGTDDIEITDFNKGIILTAPNSSRYRITVDNAGNLITTLIP